MKKMEYVYPVRLPDALIERMRDQASAEEITIAQLIRKSIKVYLHEVEKVETWNHLA